MKYFSSSVAAAVVAAKMVASVVVVVAWLLLLLEAVLGPSNAWCWLPRGDAKGGADSGALIAYLEQMAA